jgi:3-hydroxybutyryl-CoA dehydrogenase
MIEESRIVNVGIIGEGKMGTNLFYYLLDFGFSMVWVCSKDADTDKLIKSFNKKINRSLDAEIIDEITHSKLLTNTKITSDLQQLNHCDLIIEAIPEDIDSKRQLFLELEAITSDNCILASNSSSINPSEISSSLSFKNRVIGLHFFYPVALKNIVEIIISSNTSAEVIDAVKQFLSRINRDYLLLLENCSFILNKIYLDFQNEAFLIVSEEDMTFSQVDTLIKKYLLPVGVFDFCDSVGNDTMLASVRNYTRNYPDKDRYLKFTLELERLVKENKTGVKGGAGFYSYPLEANEENLSLNEIMNEKVIERLQITMTSSIKKFSAQSGINLNILNNAMKEYLGSERDLFGLKSLN